MTQKIDRRISYFLVVDTETVNTLTNADGSLDMSCVLVYDCGWQVIDKRGKVYESASYVNSDIFYGEQKLMQSAYYARKIPQYHADLAMGKRILADTYEIKRAMRNVVEKWQVKAIVAHNAAFDYRALNNTQRWITKSKYRYFTPYGVPIYDTMKMARDVIHAMPTYRKFCAKYNLFTPSGKLSTTAQNLYRFITKNPDFQEAHTGLEDVQIESQIFAYCYKQHKKMRKLCWGS